MNRIKNILAYYKMMLKSINTHLHAISTKNTKIINLVKEIQEDYRTKKPQVQKEVVYINSEKNIEEPNKKNNKRNIYILLNSSNIKEFDYAMYDNLITRFNKIYDFKIVTEKKTIENISYDDLIIVYNDYGVDIREFISFFKEKDVKKVSSSSLKRDIISSHKEIINFYDIKKVYSQYNLILSGQYFECYNNNVNLPFEIHKVYNSEKKEMKNSFSILLPEDLSFEKVEKLFNDISLFDNVNIIFKNSYYNKRYSKISEDKVENLNDYVLYYNEKIIYNYDYFSFINNKIDTDLDVIKIIYTDNYLHTKDINEINEESLFLFNPESYLINKKTFKKDITFNYFIGNFNFKKNNVLFINGGSKTISPIKYKMEELLYILKTRKKDYEEIVSEIFECLKYSVEEYMELSKYDFFSVVEIYYEEFLNAVESIKINNEFYNKLEFLNHLKKNEYNEYVKSIKNKKFIYQNNKFYLSYYDKEEIIMKNKDFDFKEIFSYRFLDKENKKIEIFINLINQYDVINLESTTLINDVKSLECSLNDQITLEIKGEKYERKTISVRDIIS